MVYVEEKRSFQMHSLNFWLINLNALVVKIGHKSNRFFILTYQRQRHPVHHWTMFLWWVTSVSYPLSFHPLAMIHSGEASLYQENSTITLTDRSLFLISYRNLAVTMGSWQNYTYLVSHWLSLSRANFWSRLDSFLYCFWQTIKQDN